MSKQQPFGVITHDNKSSRRTDFLYRVSLKCVVHDERGDVLVVKETGRDRWDLPGGGMDHGEDLRSSIAREMREEVNLHGDFTYWVIDVDEPAHLQTHNLWQLRLIFEVIPEQLKFSAGDDGDEVAFMNPQIFMNSDSEVERRIYRYHTLS